tara:strand:- start:426 stop:1262 length:837 start_codon:yes stop_codon:yes gene_type:complete
MSETQPYNSEFVLEAMTIRQNVDSKIQGLYESRSLQECAGFMLPKLKPNYKLLDCGCGPGQIATGFAKLLSEGEVVGIDANIEHVNKARALAEKNNLTNMSVHQGNIFNMPFEDNTFDVAFFHTVICNIHDPITALKEVNRVLKPGGIIAAREPDYSTSIWFPESNDLQLGLRALKNVQQGYSDALVGSKLKHYINKAGFSSPEVSASCDTYGSPEKITEIASYLKAQLLSKDVYESLIEDGYLDAIGVEKACQAFDDMCTNPDSIYMYALVEVIAKK